MKSNFGKFISAIAVTAALILFIFIELHSETTVAQSSFAGNLPAGYTAYSGQMGFGKSCSCSTSTIAGEPPLAPPCQTSFCFGSSSTRYGWVNTNTPGIHSSYCDEARQSGRPIPPCFLLDGDDAVVVSGTMSPVQGLTYYSFMLYQAFTYDPNYQSNYAAIESSVGLGFNNVTLKMGSNGKYVLIAAANTQTLNVVKQALAATGVPDAIMNTYLVPASLTTLGSSNYPDQLALSLRLSYQTEAEKQLVDTFVAQTAPSTVAIFVKGPGTTGDVTVNDLPKWENTLRANPIEYNAGLDKKLAALETVVTNSYVQKGYTLKASLAENLLHVNSSDCRTNHSGCVYDSPDAIYSSFPCDFAPTKRNNNCGFSLGVNSTDVLMLLGVDHTLVGNQKAAAYLSAESQKTPGSQDGTFSYVSLYTQGSAKQYLAANNATSLYAVKVARTCGSQPYCAAIPYQGSTGNKTGFYIVGRTYLDKVTGSGPNPANLVPAKLLWFSKNS